jgi:predicted O-linked N-acetylglucosamine transferase (SPINDLY family)
MMLTSGGMRGIMADLAHALTLWQGGRRAEAETAILEVLRAAPADPGALRALAEIYAASGRPGQAAVVWRRWIDQHPADAGAHRQLAQALLADRQIPAAIDVLRRALELDPANARAHNNLGLAQLRAGDAAGAVASLRQAVAIEPGYALGHMNLGLALERLPDAAGARASYETALRLDRHLAQARIHLSELILPVDPVEAGRERDRAIESHAINLMTMRRHDEAVPLWTRLIDSGAGIAHLEGMRFHCRLHNCDWSGYAATAARLEAEALEGRDVDLPFSLFVYSQSPAAQLACARAYVAARHPPVAPDTVGDADGTRHGAAGAHGARIKVAYVSFDFHEHATAYLVAGLLEQHDRSRFEVSAFSYGADDGSPMRRRLQRAVDRFVDVRQRSDGEIAGTMRDLGIDIAVDLKGHTGGARTGIFAHRAAPLQVNFLGYPGTLGADYYDYLIADRHVIPARDEPYYSERVIRLAGCYQPNDPQRPLPTAAPPRTEQGLPDHGFVFCSFNNLYKITPAVFDVWMELLRASGGSVLWLLEGTPAALRNLQSEARARGVDPRRLIFAPHVPLATHLARYRLADLFLDTLPCNAHTTASDALWMGVPVVTLTGAAFAGRVATSLLHAVGLPQLCTTSLAEYKAVALELAREPAKLATLKAHLESGRGGFALFDTARYCRDLERAYQLIWARHAAGGAARALDLGGHAAPDESALPG